MPLKTLFQEVGVLPEAKWFLAEAMDAAVMTRSIPVEKGWESPTGKTANRYGPSKAIPHGYSYRVTREART